MSRRLFGGLLVGLGLILVLLFGFRLAHALRRWGTPPRPQPMATTTDVSLIREWMTIPYVAHTYGVPDKALFDALDIAANENRRKSLIELNEEYFPKQDGFVVARVQEAILAFQGHEPLPPIPETPPAAPIP